MISSNKLNCFAPINGVVTKLPGTVQETRSNNRPSFFYTLKAYTASSHYDRLLKKISMKTLIVVNNFDELNQLKRY